MQNLNRFTAFSLLVLASACSSPSDRDNARSARQPELSIPYTQDWETGAGEWSSAVGEAATLTNDATSTAGASVQKLDRATFGGDYFSPYLPVQGGQVYCVSAKIKWVSGAAPFIGIERSSESGWLGVSWLFGTAYSDTYGRTQAISSTDTEWQNLSRSVFIPSGTSRIRITDELYAESAKEGPPLAYIDDLSVANGACAPYVQDWESGAGGWADKSGQAPTLVTDETSPDGPKVQQLDRATFGGDYFSPYMAVKSGQAYCVRASIKWVTGAAPFVGIEMLSESAWLGVSWQFGAVYSDAHGSTQAISSVDSGWQNFSRTVMFPAVTTEVRLTDELYFNITKDGPSLSYVEGLSIADGPCPFDDVFAPLVAGGNNTCLLTVSHGVRCWGDDQNGQLGYVPTTYGPYPTSTTYCAYSPPTSDVLTGVRALTAGRSTCALMDTGGVRCWGTNYYGQLGDGTTSDRLTPPASDVLSGVRSIAAGYFHTCALMDYGGVRCWGHNNYGQLGDGTTTDRSTPPSTDVLTGVQAIAAGYDHTCALMDYGGVRCWGKNETFQLGDGTRTSHLSPPKNDVLTGVQAIAAGDFHTCALMNTGGVRCWGYGTRGDGNIDAQKTPPISDVLTGVRAISSGGYYICALTDSRGIRCWGLNGRGQIGNGTVTWCLTPTDDILTNVRAIATGGEHTCAMLDTGGIRCWGANFMGQLGDGTNIDRSLPVNVIGFP